LYANFVIADKFEFLAPTPVGPVAANVVSKNTGHLMVNIIKSKKVKIF